MFSGISSQDQFIMTVLHRNVQLEIILQTQAHLCFMHLILEFLLEHLNEKYR